MKTYNFTIMLETTAPFTDEMVDSIYTKCEKEFENSDAFISSCGDIIEIMFCRGANSYQEAFDLAVKDVEDAGCKIDFEATRDEQFKSLLR